MAWIIGKLPAGTTIHDSVIFRGALILATTDGIYAYDGDGLIKLDPVPPPSPDHGRLRIESKDGLVPTKELV